ncbi:MAG: DUF5813 family protein [Halanaeroarchaeum sp.]
MTDGLAEALAAHDRFERSRVTSHEERQDTFHEERQNPPGDDHQDAFVPTQVTFDARVYVESDGVTIVNVVPTLDAAVSGETVAPVVEDGWYDTFERRVEGIGGVTTTDDVTVTAVDRGAETVTVETALDASPGTVADDVVAVVSFVEGTWVEGIIPGYDYVDTVERVRQRARQNAQGSTEA